jgi:hypothetical protein
MERRHNPYAPGAGLQPPELAGRDRLIEDAAIDMDRLLDRRPTKGMMLLGLRGVGKTALLNRLHHMADEKGIHTAKIEAPEGGTLPQLLAPELRRILYGLDLQTAAGGRELGPRAAKPFAPYFPIPTKSFCPGSMDRSKKYSALFAPLFAGSGVPFA